MKRMKKVFAMLLAFAMVMGMSLTTFAANENYKSDITITGLVENDKTNINVWQIISLDSDANNWVVADWAAEYVEYNEETKEWDIDLTELAKVATEARRYASKADVNTTSETFEEVPVGAYYITVAGDKNSYNPMIAETYKEAEKYMTAEDVTVVAKGSDYQLDKDADDNFVKRGDVVTFTVSTIFPSFETGVVDPSYVIEDAPVGLDITEIKSVQIGGTDVAYEGNEVLNEDGVSTKLYSINLSQHIGTGDTFNENAGKFVTIVYKATVLVEDGYDNVVSAKRNNKVIGQDDEYGASANIKVTKYAAGTTTPLAGAQFKVYEVTVEGESQVKTLLGFVATETAGVYKLALNNETPVEALEVDANGVLTVLGLEEGTYWFEETLAPLGYSINEKGETVTVEASQYSEDAEGKEKISDVSATGTIYDTKLSALPSTGGIGTAVFTIGGCVIMIAAAYFFFVSRKKEA